MLPSENFRMKYINLDFKRCGKYFTITVALICPRIPLYYSMIFHDIIHWKTVIEEPNPRSVRGILVHEDWRNSILHRTLSKCIIFTFSRKLERNQILSKYHCWKKISLHIAHFTWWTMSRLINLSLTLHSGESGVFCSAWQFVSSKCFSVKKAVAAIFAQLCW